MAKMTKQQLELLKSQLDEFSGVIADALSTIDNKDKQIDMLTEEVKFLRGTITMLSNRPYITSAIGRPYPTEYNDSYK